MLDTMPTAIDYAAQIDLQHYIVLMKLSSITLEDAGTAAANNGAQLSSWLDASKAISGLKPLAYSGDDTSFELLVDSKTLTPTTAELQSNIAKLTFASATGSAVGDIIKVASLPAPFTSLNTTSAVVTAVTTTPTHTVSYSLTGTNIASASVNAGVVTTGVYPLNGSGRPIQLLNITGSPISSQTADESVNTHDQVARGSAISIGISNSRSAAFKGMAVHKSIDYKIMQLLNEKGVGEKLAVKYLRVGPGGTTEKKLGYARVSSVSEEGDAPALAKYNFTLTFLGEVYTIFDNAV